MNKKVLILSYFFPPLGGSGVQRILKFVKYLPNYGYEPIILTVNPFFSGWIKDKCLLKQINPMLKVYRYPTFDIYLVYKLLWFLKLKVIVTWISRHIFIPDTEITWLPFAKMGIKKIFKENKIDAILITAGPFSTLLLIPYLKQKYNIPIVVDYRDEWTTNPLRLEEDYPLTTLEKEKRFEKHSVICTDAFVFVNQKMAQNYCQKYPLITTKPYQIIPNGYDEDDFSAWDSVTRATYPTNKVFTPENSLSNSKTKLKIVYTGSFYDRRQPEIVWRALSELIVEKRIAKSDIEFVIIGKNKPEFVLGSFKHNSIITDMIKFIPYLSHSEMIAALYQATALLLFIVSGPNCEVEMTGKIFEYLRSKKPILAIIPPNGVAAEIIRNCHAGFVYDSANLQNIKEGIMYITNLFHAGKLSIDPDMNIVSNFERRKLTEKLSNLLDVVTH